MSEATFKTTPTGSAPPFVQELIGLVIHPDGAKAAEPDGALVALCNEFQAVEDELNRIYEALADMHEPERGLHPLAQKETDGVERIHELRELIADLPARTPEGLRAKAKVALVDMSEDGSGTLEPVDHQQWIGWSLARDVLGRAVG